MFITNFSGTMKAVKLKLDRLMYLAYQKKGQEFMTLGVTSLDRFYNLQFAINEEFSQEL